MEGKVYLDKRDNRIKYAEYNDNGLFTKFEDITDECIDAVYEHFKRKFDTHDELLESLGYEYESGGQIVYYPPEQPQVVKVGKPNLRRIK